MTTTFEEFSVNAAAGGMVPLTHQVVLDGDTPVTTFRKLHRGTYGFLLESLEGGNGGRGTPSSPPTRARSSGTTAGAASGGRRPAGGT